MFLTEMKQMSYMSKKNVGFYWDLFLELSMIVIAIVYAFHDRFDISMLSFILIEVRQLNNKFET